jgi:surfeit locus 1 family protein
VTQSLRTGSFVALMLAATAMFVALGVWQLQRLEFKRQLIEAADTRVGALPVPLPPPTEWGGMTPEDYDFTPVRFDGVFAPEDPVLVFTSLGTPNGTHGGPGYWIMHVVMLAGGGRVWVNRGFVPDNRLADFDSPPAGTVTLTGLMRRPEATNWFTPPAEPGARRDYVRDPQRFPRRSADTAPTAPFTVDLIATGAGLPQAGETVIDFPNRHFEYALTWFALAAVTPLLLTVWLRRRGRSTQLAPRNTRD